MKFVVAFEQSLDPFRTVSQYPGDQNVRHVPLDVREHGGLIRIEIIVLGGHHNGLHAQWGMVIGILDGHLTFAVGPEISHFLALTA